MHELGLVLETIASVEKIAKENDVLAVVSLTLEVGEVSSIVPSYFRECFEWAKLKTDYMRECELEIVIIKGISYCQDCRQNFDTVQNGKKCPHCGSESTYLITGNELTIHDIKVKTKDAPSEPQ